MPAGLCEPVRGRGRIGFGRRLCGFGRRAHTRPMARARANRRVATVLFADIVDSTRIAAEVGDRRWRDLLGAFRRRVRGELKRHGGHEEDTAGDGFFATFAQPAEAIRAAVGILRQATLIGLEVRCGLHTGELERIDGRLGGIAAHIGARTMAEASAGEVLVTATVHDLATGSMVAFTEHGERTLRGVPGTWRLYRVVAVDGEPLAVAMEAGEATERRGAIAMSTSRRGAWVALGAGAMLLVLLTAGAMLVRPTSPADKRSSPAPSLPTTVLRIDAATGAITAQVHDRYLALSYPSPLWEVDGNLWQVSAIYAIRRDAVTGEVLATVPLPQNTDTAYAVTFAFGSIWAHTQLVNESLVRFDPINGRTIAEIQLPKRIRFFQLHAGTDAVWLLTLAGTLLEVDPLTNEVVGEYPVETETVADAFTILGNTAWICECEHGRLTRFDLETHEASPAIELAQRGLVVPDSAEGSLAGPSSSNGEVWLLDAEAGTVSQVDVATGQAGRPLAIPRPVWDAEFGLGALWVAGWTAVHRVDLASGDLTSVDMPPDFRAASIAVDEASGSVWVASCANNGAECN